MDSYERMNDVISFIEDNITGPIDYARIARLACCPTHQFQRFFAFLADMTLADYIRRRRLSLAAEELRQGASSILDVALKYGYDSHASFSRAFRDHHGMAPSAAREKTTRLSIFPRMSFPAPAQIDSNFNYRIEKGMLKMAKVTKIVFEPFGPTKIVGKEMRTKPMTQSIPALWGRCFTDGTYDRLVEMKEHIPTDISNDYIGYMRDFDSGDGSFTYLVGMFMKPDTPVPDGYAAYGIPACTLAKAWIEGEEYDIYSNAHALTVDAIRKQGYEPDWQAFFQCEVYTDERLGVPKSKGEKVLTLDFYLPCKMM